MSTWCSGMQCALSHVQGVQKAGSAADDLLGALEPTDRL